ncbi:TIGR04283 family arsenosugar biosynthesis glycosyltransferase [Desulfobulbus alkaliphilus]|uniref:TIGR04283 family arsenosugar biosynthesis glycosyltransferase n=1 Tax=Desulfobulbus alkaliphilus TaxID=869814 RepID=UPI001966ACEF|nr:TIGR04283 family arsenosugar biosynthesis glycosyltransferase [Desulfobulbus alkaliphilus]MBM9537870.1 TIGR04283 family arsenosugar biosynthesis glycosyltransferase [Desulfobulbus alkaliphilus]
MGCGYRPVLSIIIPTLNEAGILPLLLADLEKQRDCLFEILVGDGGSVDATRTVAETFGARWIPGRRGRGAQMNAAAEQARGTYLLFLHADSRIMDPLLLARSLQAIQEAALATAWVAGHFRLRFIRSQPGNTLAYRFLEEKTGCNRLNTVNGDQGLLLTRQFFRFLGGFDERLPFLEDQRLVSRIRTQGTLMTLPGLLGTSARRFETEGFHRRYILMSIIMGMDSIGEESFFAKAPGVYRVQQETGKLLLSPFFSLLWDMLRRNWGLPGSIRKMYRLGRYTRAHAWQLFFLADVCLRPLLGTGRYPLLALHDRIFAPCTNFRICNALAGLLCMLWFMGVLAPYFRVQEALAEKIGAQRRKKAEDR